MDTKSKRDSEADPLLAEMFSAWLRLVGLWSLQQQEIPASQFKSIKYFISAILWLDFLL